MDFCYTVIIHPITVLMEFVLGNMISITNSSLFSLIFLSFVITIVSFPFSFIAEKWQEKERKIQKKLKPKIDEFKSVFKGAALNNYINTLYRQNNYHPVFAVRSSIGFLIQIPFFLAAYIFISNYEPLSGTSVLFFKDLGRPDGLIQIKEMTINVMPFVMTAVNLFYAFIYGRKLSFRENFHNYFISIVFLILLYNASSALLIYWTANNLFGIIKNLVSKKLDRKLSNASLTGNVDRSFSFNYFSALISLTLLVFFTVPFVLLASGSGYDIDGTFSGIISFQLMLSTIFIIVMTFVFYFSPVFLKKFMAGLLSAIYLYFLCNVFFFPGDYGDMSNFFFEEGLAISFFDKIFNIMIFVLIVITISFLFYLKRVKFINKILTLLLISLAFFSFYEGSVFYEKVHGRDNALAEEFDKKFVFSKNHKNVIVILLDRFIGGYIPELIKLMPELETEILDGFVWYPRSLSSGSDTLSSEPSIMGGWDYHADTINRTRTNIPLLDKMDESIRIMPYNFSKAGCNSYIYGYLSSWMKKDRMDHLNDTVVENLTGKYLDIWLKKKQWEGVDSEFTEKLAVFGFFRAAPPLLREKIYDEGHWNLSEKKIFSIVEKTKDKKKQKVRFDDEGYVLWKETNNFLISNYLKNWSTLESLPEISSVSETNGGQFFYFSSKLTHEPWITDENFDISVDAEIKYRVELYKKFGKSMNALKHLYTDGAALKLAGEWFSFMKDHGVYDNTRIIIVSDHGRRVYNPMFKKQRLPGTKNKSTPAQWHNILLVKDFNSRGALRKNSKFMTTCDVPYLAMKGIIDGKNPYTGNPVSEKTEKIPFTVLRTKFRIREQGKYKYNFKEAFEINDENIFNISKWKRVENVL